MQHKLSEFLFHFKWVMIVISDSGKFYDALNTLMFDLGVHVITLLEM